MKFQKKQKMVAETEKLTWNQVCDIIKKYHSDNNIEYVSDRTKYPILKFNIVFDPFASGWPKYNKKLDESGKTVDDLDNPRTYSEESCTYRISDASKYWFSNLCGNSLDAYCINPKDSDSAGIRLELYLGHWKILYCYRVN